MKNYSVRAIYDNLDALSQSVGPALQLSLDLTVAKMSASGAVSVGVPDTATRLDVYDVRAQLYFIHPDGSHRFLVEGAPIYWNPIFLSLEGSSTRIALVFPIRNEQLIHVEDMRKGGKVRMKATLRILGATDNPPGMIAVPEMEIRQGSSQFIEVEKSKWVEDVLPRMGWGSWRLIEIPFSATQDELGKIDDLLGEAHKQYGMGNWADCLTVCRKAVEELQPHVKEFVNPAHSDDRGGPAPKKIEELGEEFKNLSTSMLEFQAGVRKMLAAGAHKLPLGTTLERADAEFGILLTIALRRYVGLRMQKEKA